MRAMSEIDLNNDDWIHREKWRTAALERRMTLQKGLFILLMESFVTMW